MTGRPQRFRDLPLFYKLLVPFLALMLVTGVVGALLIVADQSTRAQTAIDESLSRRALDTRSLMHDRELYLVESVSLAANLQGMAAAAARHDRAEVETLLRSVAALKQDLTLVAVVDSHDDLVGSYDRLRIGLRAENVDHTLVARALARPEGRAAGLVRIRGRWLLAVASAICADSPCRPTAATLAALDAGRLAGELSPAASPGATSTVTLFEPAGSPVAVSGRVHLTAAPEVSTDVRRTHDMANGRVATLYSPLVVQGDRIGTIAVSIPTGSAFGPVRGSALRLAAILFAAMVGVLAIGAYLSRSILRQVRPLVETSRRLGSGDLAARATVVGNDELGELALGVNDMAAQLEASYATLEERVAARTAEVEQLLRERTDFFTAISHDFRTPLAVILSQADLLLDTDIPKTSALARDAGRTVKESAAQLLARINDILDLARADSGGLDIELRPIALDRVFATLAETARGLSAASGVDVVVRRVPRGLATLADGERLVQVLLNLLDNAVKYTPGGGKVELSAGSQGGRVVIRVSDTGVGIPTEAGERVFEPFYRVKGSKPQRGAPSSGLGLALAKRLIEAQNGDISFAPNPGAGTTFVVSLAAAPAERRNRRPVTSSR